MSDTAQMKLSKTGDKRQWIKLNPINQRRLHNFKANRRGFWSVWIFLFLFVVTLFAEFVANDKPFVVSYEDELYFPVFVSYPETTFGGDFPTEADYRDPYVMELIEEAGVGGSRLMVL